MKPNYIYLVIEDNAIDQIITKELLKKVPGAQEISIANNGMEGIQWLQNHPAKQDEILIILLDIKMPVMDGFGFLSEYENLKEEIKKQTQIFILSSTLNTDEINRGNTNPYVKSVLSKPLPFKEFSEMI
jgi:CheY-like chemotaxis protein